MIGAKITPSGAQNFGASVGYGPSDAESAECAPDALAALRSETTDAIAAGPKQAMKTQARIPPEAVVRLLK